MTLPLDDLSVPTGTVRWHAEIVRTVPAGGVDEILQTAPGQGTVTFVPGTSELRLYDGNDPRTVFLSPLTYGIGADGILRDITGDTVVTLPADAANPKAWTWTVHAVLGDIKWPPFTFHLSPGQNLDLTTAAPVQASSGTWYAVGPAGPVGANFKGVWSSTTAYLARDSVSYNGSSWVAITGSTGVTPADGSTWQLLAAQGPVGTISNLPDATSTVKGVVQLAGDLAGTAAAPTVAKIGGQPIAAVATTGAYSSLSGTPTLAQVATTGNYADLAGKPTLYSDEAAQDATAALFANGSHTGVTFTYDDANNKISAAVTVKSWVQMTQAAYTALATKDPNTLYVIVG